MPDPLLPLMTLRVPPAVPPTVLFDAPVSIRTPVALARAATPLGFRPIQLPWIMLPEVPAPRTQTPMLLPASTLPAPPAPGVPPAVPPTVLPLAPASIRTP